MSELGEAQQTISVRNGVVSGMSASGAAAS